MDSLRLKSVFLCSIATSIFVARVIDVSIGTLRLFSCQKAKKTAPIGFF